MSSISEPYAIICITNFEIHLPEPIRPSWELVLQGLPSGLPKDTHTETISSVSVPKSKDSPSKCTHQDWLQRAVFTLHSKDALSRIIHFKVFRQSTSLSKKRLFAEAKFPVSQLIRSQHQEIISIEVPDQKGGNVILNLTCDLNGVQYWHELFKNVSTGFFDLDSPETGSFLKDFYSLCTDASIKDKFVSYLRYKDFAKELLAFLPSFMKKIEQKLKKLQPSNTGKRKSKKKDLQSIEQLESIRTQVVSIVENMLKDMSIRKCFLDAGYISKVIEWVCDGVQLSHLSAAGLASFKPLFSIDSHQVELAHAGVIHLIIHILNPKSELGSVVSESVQATALQILPYFSHRFYPIIEKAGIVDCISKLLAQESGSKFHRGIELMLFWSAASNSKTEILKTFLPILESSIGSLSSQIKEAGLIIQKLTPKVISNHPTSNLMDLDLLISMYHDAIPKTVPEPSKIELELPDLSKTATTAPTPFASATPIVRRRISDVYVPPTPVFVPASERNAAEIARLGRLVAELLDNPDANTDEISATLARIDELSTDPPIEPARAPPILSANVGLTDQELLDLLQDDQISESSSSAVSSPRIDINEALASINIDNNDTTDDNDIINDILKAPVIPTVATYDEMINQLLDAVVIEPTNSNPSSPRKPEETLRNSIRSLRSSIDSLQLLEQLKTGPDAGSLANSVLDEIQLIVDSAAEETANRTDRVDSDSSASDAPVNRTDRVDSDSSVRDAPVNRRDRVDSVSSASSSSSISPRNSHRFPGFIYPLPNPADVPSDTNSNNIDIPNAISPDLSSRPEIEELRNQLGLNDTGVRDSVGAAGAKESDSEQLKLSLATMAELERLVSAPLLPITRFYHGAESLFLSSPIIASLFTIFQYSTSPTLKLNILTILDGICGSKFIEVYKSHNPVDVLLDIVLQTCAVKPTGHDSGTYKLPAHIEAILSLLKAQRIQYTAQQYEIIANICLIHTRYDGLHTMLLEAVESCEDLYAMAPSIPNLIGSLVRLLDLPTVTLRNAALSTLRTAIVPPDRDFSRPISKERFCFLATLLRDPTFVGKFSSYINPGFFEQLFAPILSTFIDQPTSMLKSELIATMDQGAKINNHIHTLKPGAHRSVLGSPSIDGDCEVTLRVLFDGSFAIWNAIHSLQTPNIGMQLLRQAAPLNNYSHQVHKLTYLKILPTLPYFNQLIQNEPKLFVQLINSDKSNETFEAIVHLMIKLQTRTLQILVRDGVDAALFYRTKHMLSSFEDTFRVLLTRMCLETDMWRNEIKKGSSQYIFIASNELRGSIMLELIKYLSPEDSAYLSDKFFILIFNNIEVMSSYTLIGRELLDHLMAMPIFWTYLKVYRSLFQLQLFRLICSNPSRYLFILEKILESTHIQGLSADGFVEYFLTHLRQNPPNLLSDMHLLTDFLIQDSGCNKDYKLLTSSSSIPDGPNEMSSELKSMVNTVLSTTDIDVKDWTCCWSTPGMRNPPSANAYAIINKAANDTPILIVGFDGTDPLFGGFISKFPSVLKQNDKVSDIMAKRATFPGLNVTSDGNFEITDAQARIFYKHHVAHPTSSNITSVTITSNSLIQFGNVLTFDTKSPLYTAYNRTGDAYVHREKFPSTFPYIHKICVFIPQKYSIPTYHNLRAYLMLLLEHSETELFEHASPHLLGLIHKNPQGLQMLLDTDSYLRQVYGESNPVHIRLNKLTGALRAPGYALSTNWKAIIGSNKKPQEENLAIETSKCFAFVTEKRQDKQVLSLIRNKEAEAKSSDFAVIPDTKVVPEPYFTRFMISMIRLSTNSRVPDGVVVFLSDKPLPEDQIISTPAPNADLARLAPWPVPPTSIIDFSKLKEQSSDSFVLKSKFIAVPYPVAANYMMIVGFSDSDNPPDQVIFSACLLGTTHLKAGKPLIPSIDYLIPFIKDSEVLITTQIEPNDDLKGIIYQIGTNFGSHEWENPFAKSKININISSSLYRPSTMKVMDIVGRQPASIYWGTSLPVYFIVDLKEYAAKPTHFAFRHGYESSNSFIQNWRLEGSNDKETWTTLFHQKESVFTRAYEMKVFSLQQPCNLFYRYWRVITDSNYYMGPGTTGLAMMCCSGFDLFGAVTARVNQKSS